MADPSQIAHLLRRTEYVARPSRVAELSPLALDAAVDNILNFDPTPVSLPVGLTVRVADNAGYLQWVDAVKWWVDRMVDSPKPLQEKMTFFWHGHFTSSWDKVGEGFLMAAQNKLYRDNAVGNFRVLAQAMALQPAMLIYLDNADNEAGSPNQNFARELMELFLLGVGNYSEDDVVAAAQAWTGYTINQDAFTYEFHGNIHDYSQKWFFGELKDWAGPQIIDKILDFKGTIVSRYIAKKLWEYFAHQNPPTAVLDAIAPGFAADWNIKSLLKAMFLRPEFYATTARQGMVRNPVEWMTAVMYHTGLRSEQLHPQWFLEGMGQEPFNPPNVSGWRPNGYWINTSSFARRATFARQATWHLRDSNNPNPFSALLNAVPSQTISAAIDSVCGIFDLLPLSAATRTAMTTYLTTQRAAQKGWWEPTNLLTMAMIAPELHAV